MNREVIILTPKDVRVGQSAFYHNVTVNHFKSDIREAILYAHLVIYKDGYDINILKSRYGGGHVISWSPQEEVKTLHRLQQKFLSDYLDNPRFLKHTKMEYIYLICKILQNRSYPVDKRAVLNAIRNRYVKG